MARTVERAPNPTNSLPFSRGNTSERVESELATRALGPARDEEAGRGERSASGAAATAADAARTNGGLGPPAPTMAPRAGWASLR